jgi:hypothetical protein
MQKAISMPLWSHLQRYIFLFYSYGYLLYSFEPKARRAHSAQMELMSIHKHRFPTAVTIKNSAKYFVVKCFED